VRQLIRADGTVTDLPDPITIPKARALIGAECVDTVRKLVTCDNCTREQAEAEPALYAVDEYDLEVQTWKTLKVEANPPEEA